MLDGTDVVGGLRIRARRVWGAARRRGLGVRLGRDSNATGVTCGWAAGGGLLERTGDDEALGMRIWETGTRAWWRQCRAARPPSDQRVTLTCTA